MSPTNPASVNKKTILVSIPSPDDSPGLSKFAEKLENAFKSQFGNGAAQNSIIINKQSPRKDEMSIITIQYCFPIRAIDWLSAYKERYERFLNTGNESTDRINAILLHSEGEGKDLPSLYALSEEEIDKVRAARQAAQTVEANVAMVGVASTTPAMPGVAPTTPVTPPMPGTAPGMPPMPPVEPEISVHVFIGGQQYGPYKRDICKQLVQNGQLTQQTPVWMEGLAAWTPAGQVPQLASLFAPVAAPGMPPMPPSMPPMPPAM